MPALSLSRNRPLAGAGGAPCREPVVKISRVVNDDPAELDEWRAITRESLLFQRALGVAEIIGCWRGPQPPVMSLLSHLPTSIHETVAAMIGPATSDVGPLGS
jgi:hypothetical protein